jgi:hypothetical protein
MATQIAHISWDGVPGATGYLLEYKLSSSDTWLTPETALNPSLNLFYDLTINANTYYDIRITTFGSRCSPNSRTQQIFAAADACCPPGYTLSMDETYCYQNVDTAATPPSDQEVTVAKPSTEYGPYGTLVYDPGYSIDGYGSFTQIPTSNAFWINGPINNTDGPNNRTALWATTEEDNQDVGFTVCVNLPEDGIYYCAGMADNYLKIILDGTPIVVMDPIAMGTYLDTHGFPGIGAFSTFRLWHVYPVQLTAGSHVLELIGHNDSSIAAMGAEIYNATLSDLISATSYTDLGEELIFSSKDYIGEDVQIGTGGVGYTCPDGYSLTLCDGPAYCRKVLTTGLVAC